MKRYIVLLKNIIISKCIRWIAKYRNEALWKFPLPILLKMKGINVNPEHIAKVLKVLIQFNSKVIGLSSAESINAFNDTSFYKLSLNTNCDERLNKEYNNWVLLKETSLSEYLISDLRIDTLLEVTVLSMPIVTKISDTGSEKLLSSLFCDIKTTGTLGNQFLTDDMRRGIQLIKSYGQNPDRLLELIVEQLIPYWLNECGNIGFSHGDLHVGNIMLEDERLVIIDLDRATLKGNQILDVFHFVISLFLEKYKNWCDCLLQLHCDMIPDYLSHYTENIENRNYKIMYALDRLGKEYGHNRLLQYVDIEYIKYVKESMEGLLWHCC